MLHAMDTVRMGYNDLGYHQIHQNDDACPRYQAAVVTPVILGFLDGEIIHHSIGDVRHPEHEHQPADGRGVASQQARQHVEGVVGEEEQWPRVTSPPPVAGVSLGTRRSDGVAPLGAEKRVNHGCTRWILLA